MISSHKKVAETYTKIIILRVLRILRVRVKMYKFVFKKGTIVLKI